MKRLSVARRARIGSMELSFRHQASLVEDLDVGGAAVEQWWVGVSEGEAEENAQHHVADIHIVRGRLGHPELWEALDAIEGDLETVGSTVLDLGTMDLAEDLNDSIEPLGDHLLILNSVQLAEEWRGYGLGALLAGIALQKLRPGARLATAFPAPLDGSTGEARERAIEKLGAVWAGIGFKPYRDGVWVLDLNRVELDNAVPRLRKRFGVQS